MCCCCVACGNPALVPVGYWVRPGLDAKTAASGRANVDQCSPGALPQCSVGQSATADPCLPRRPSRTHRLVQPRLLGSFGLGLSVPCVPSQSGVFLPSCGAPALQPHRPSKPSALRALCPDARPSGWGADQVLRTLWWENLCDVITFQPVGRSPGGCRI